VKTFCYWALVAVLAGSTLTLIFVCPHGSDEHIPSNFVHSDDGFWVVTGDHHIFEITERAFNVKSIDGYAEGRGKWTPLGGPGPHQPHSVTAGMNRSIGEDELVIGVSTPAGAAAYPLRVVARHQVVNDRVGGWPVLVHFGEKNRAAAAYTRRRGAKEPIIGTTGLIRGNTHLLFDRETESLLDPLLGRFVAGELLGQSFELLPSAVVPLSQWLEMKPDSLVLTLNTGIVSTKYPVRDVLEEKSALKTPGGEEMRMTYPLGSPVLVLAEGGEHVIVAFEAARELGKREIHTECGGAPRTVLFDGNWHTARALLEDGEPARCLRTVWVSAVATFPDARPAQLR